MKNIIGTKIGMTRIFDNKGNMFPVTIIKINKCWITAIKTINNNGYNALQIGYDIKNNKNINKPYRGIFKNIKEGLVPNFIKEFRYPFGEDMSNYLLGNDVLIDDFEIGDYVDVSGISKGKGYTGVMKRHNFNGLPATHGNGEYRRRSGSLSASSYPSRVFKGVRMAGHFGNNKVTIHKLEIVDINKDENLIILKGSVPGIKGSYLKIKETNKALKKKKIVIEQKSEEVKLNKKR